MFELPWYQNNKIRCLVDNVSNSLPVLTYRLYCMLFVTKKKNLFYMRHLTLLCASCYVKHHFGALPLLFLY